MSPAARFVKRSLDIGLALFSLAVLSPLLLVLALAVRFTSKGPVLYKTARTGRNGVPFRMYKFRSMIVGAEQAGGLSTAKDDPRVTRVGRFLRRHKLDELPQLVNILKGDMSIVGPRPEFAAYTDQYSAEERLILTVRPGLTDFASLEYFHLDQAIGADQPDKVYEEQVRPIKNSLRIRYVKTQSLLTDCALILRTIGRLLRA